MAILMSIHNIWCEKILNGTKILEFRNNIGKNFSIGDTIYIYETFKNNGRKMVVGEVKIKDIKEIPKSKCGCYGLLPYYAQHIVTDEETKKAIIDTYNVVLPNYDGIFKMKWMFLPKYLEKFKATGRLPDFMLMKDEEFKEYEEKSFKAQLVMEDCDNWLRDIGYYNEYDETFYKKYIELEKPYRYKTPISIKNFKNLKGEILKKAPQSWCYVQKI